MLTLEKLTLVQDDFRLTADLTVATGTITALIGPSGAGKSSLLSAIAGFFPPQSGRILWQGQDIGRLPPGQRPMSILFQDQNLFPHLTLARNLGLGLRSDLRLTADDWRKVDTALARVGLSGMGDRKPGTLSGGQQSRAALARTLLRARPLLLLDEPFAALGPGLKAEMLDLVRTVAQDGQMTVLLVTHDPGDARRIASHTILVAEGRADPPVPTGTLFANPPSALASYLGK